MAGGYAGVRTGGGKYRAGAESVSPALRDLARFSATGPAGRAAVAHRIAPASLAELGAQQRVGAERAAPGAEFRASVFSAGSGIGRAGRGHCPATAGGR